MATPEDLEKFVTQVTRPDDFGNFWHGVLEQLAEIPLEPHISPVPLRSNGEVHGKSLLFFGGWGGLENSIDTHARQHARASSSFTGIGAWTHSPRIRAFAEALLGLHRSPRDRACLLPSNWLSSTRRPS